jgi:hypothetical protein
VSTTSTHPILIMTITSAATVSEKFTAALLAHDVLNVRVVPGLKHSLRSLGLECSLLSHNCLLVVLLKGVTANARATVHGKRVCVLLEGAVTKHDDGLAANVLAVLGIVRLK